MKRLKSKSQRGAKAMIRIKSNISKREKRESKRIQLIDTLDDPDPNPNPILGLLRVKVLRGMNLIVCDFRSSDPYVIIKMNEQKLRTKVIKRNVNPEWKEDLILSVIDPSATLKLEVFDKDTFSSDDPMGNAELDIQPFMDVVKINEECAFPNGTIMRRVMPSRENCLVKESPIYLSNGRVVQDVALRLREVKHGQVELQLEWIVTAGFYD